MSNDHRGRWTGVSGVPGSQERTFEEWTSQLRTAGFRLCPGSFAVPVELRGLRPDGFGFQLRCRGVRVTLALFRPGRELWQVPVWDPKWSPEEGLSLWVNHPPARPLTGYRAFGHPDLSAWDTDNVVSDFNQWKNNDIPDGARMVFDREENPDHQVVFDGAREYGWRGHEAGLLRPAAVARLFAHLLAEADAATEIDAGMVLVPRARAGGPRLTRATAQ